MEVLLVSPVSSLGRGFHTPVPFPGANVWPFPEPMSFFLIYRSFGPLFPVSNDRLSSSSPPSPPPVPHLLIGFSFSAHRFPPTPPGLCRQRGACFLRLRADAPLSLGRDYRTRSPCFPLLPGAWNATSFNLVPISSPPVFLFSLFVSRPAVVLRFLECYSFAFS